MIDINLMDEWGGIDEKIRSSVLGLNQQGIETTGSCEGDKAPCPWIMMKSSSMRVKEKLQKLLREFYVGREVAHDVKIKTFPAGSRFYIFSGERKVFAQWRSSVNRTAKAIAEGTKPPATKKLISPQKYRKEFMDFGSFLLAKSGH